MAFEKGISGNIEGRPKGTPNKITKETKEIIRNFIESEIENVLSEFQEFSAKEKFDIIIKLLPYVLPKIEAETYINPYQDQTVSFNFVEVK